MTCKSLLRTFRIVHKLLNTVSFTNCQSITIKKDFCKKKFKSTNCFEFYFSRKTKQSDYHFIVSKYNSTVLKCSFKSRLLRRISRGDFKENNTSSLYNLRVVI